jgi:hypothetical protein
MALADVDVSKYWLIAFFASAIFDESARKVFAVGMMFS